MNKKTIYKTRICFTVLSEESISNKSLQSILSESDDGDLVMGTITVNELEIAGKVAVNEILEVGSDPSFFNMDVQGFEVSEEDFDESIDEIKEDE